MKTRLILYLSLLNLLFAQKKEFVVYDAVKKSISNMVFGIDSVTKLSEHTSWSYGLLTGISQLPLTPPSAPFPDAGFSDFIRAKDLFEVSYFPVRTSVKIFWVENDTMWQQCSGTMIGPNIVLTAAHCIYRHDEENDTSYFFDSIAVVVAFDRGTSQTGMQRMFVQKSFIPKSFASQNMFADEDVAILVLKESVGNSTGWLGLSYVKNIDTYGAKLFHKFSYPGIPWNLGAGQNRDFNGDTLYYNYGLLDFINNDWLGYNISGVPGQSGSSLFYSDSSGFFIVGTQKWSDQSRHYRIKGDMFYSLKEISEHVMSVSIATSVNPAGYEVHPAYPNPFNASTNISFSLPKKDQVLITIYDAIGREISVLTDREFSAGKHSVHFNALSLSSGVYFYRFVSPSFQKTGKIVLVR